MGVVGMFKQSCYGSNKVSSKRLIMYIFTMMGVFMILIEATFNLILMYKWSMSADSTCTFHMVFDGTIYGYVFALVGALAGINGFSGQEKEKKEELEPVIVADV